MSSREGLSMEGVHIEHDKKERRESKVHIWLGRHGQKEKSHPSGDDRQITLTPEGKKYAKDQSEIADITQAVAMGSGRVRAQETAALKMAGNQSEITGEESLDELQVKVDEGRNVGSKIGSDSRLDFDIDEESPFGKRLMSELENGNALGFLIKESDAYADELGDEKAFTYNRRAEKIADLIDDQIKIAKNWDKLVNKEDSKYEDTTLERPKGSHMWVTELFLAKVIELTKGEAEVDKFIEALDNTGFGYVEGYDIDIVTDDKGEMSMRIKYKKEKDDQVVFEFDQTVPLDIIRQIKGEEVKEETEA